MLITYHQTHKPIFHQKRVGVGCLMQMKSTQKNMKCTCPTPAFCVGTQRNLYSTGWRRGLASGKTQSLVLGNAKIYQHFGISNAKFWRRGHCPTPVPDARYFAFWWNIGYSLLFILVSTNKLARSQFSLSTSVNCLSFFIIFLNYLLDHVQNLR